MNYFDNPQAKTFTFSAARIDGDPNNHKGDIHLVLIHSQRRGMKIPQKALEDLAISDADGFSDTTGLSSALCPSRKGCRHSFCN